MKYLTIFAISLLAFSSQAFAYWDLQKSEKDVFGNVNVTVTSFGDNGNLFRFECGSSSEPFFVFLMRDNSGDFPEIPADFLHIDQFGKTHEVNATVGPWNDKYVAAKVTDQVALKRIADHMVVAKKSIPVGISIPLIDAKISDTFSPRGSTSAGRAILDNCLESNSGS